MNTAFLPSHQIRAAFARAMSTMYRNEVPQYGRLVSMVEQINQRVLHDNPQLAEGLAASGGLQRLSDERHGAIRLGRPEELFTMRRLFAVMGMQPVGYYDLTAAGIPVHSTAFRPVQMDELNANPFRIFTSLLRLDLIEDEQLRERASDILNQRQIFTARLLQLISMHELQHGLHPQQADEFVHEALQTFRWHPRATVDHDSYRQLLDSHPLVADIVCFRGPHINHLTPRTLDIDEAQLQMTQHGMTPKAIIEGPPARRVPILLRQTSFRAVDEPVDFPSAAGETVQATHSARFGEIEQRGLALTAKGRSLYDDLLASVREQVAEGAANDPDYYSLLKRSFEHFPDDLKTIHRLGLGYFHYTPGKPMAASSEGTLESWIADGYIDLHPIVYEDFLPVSAAGIFRSNLAGNAPDDFRAAPNQQAFEADLGCPVLDEFALYADLESQSLANCLQQLGITEQQQREQLSRLQAKR